MLREFCAENLTNVPEALAAGAHRIELCDHLSVGGTTPSDEVIAQAVALVHAHSARVMVMARPRGGDFAYREAELSAMVETIHRARMLGADGVVFGCVRKGALDEAALGRLVDEAQGMDMTFHMAFDEIDPARQGEALAALAQLGFSRVLTHGGPLAHCINDCMPHLRELVVAARGRISIMAGGGVTWENAERIAADLGICEVHGTRIVRL